ncbi:MAG: serine/threonine-protein kinase [Acidobacteriota bacterium]
MAGTTATGEVRAEAPASGAQRRQGRYVLGDLLGRGGMAEVFSGHAIGSHGFQKPVAIKRLLPELATDHVFVERLIGEAKLLVGMQHGNIVSVLDLARDGDNVFLVMEFVDGPSLRQLLKARGTRGLPLGVATYIVQSAAAGLEFAHARPGGAVIHADISPSNLLLTTSGEVRVADFGIARREGNGAGVVEGKWAYMAPEQARGEPLTPRSDVFALGVVLYELVTGKHPFGRSVTANDRETTHRVIPPRVVNPQVPPGLDAICMRALAHDAHDRYARMQQLIDALVEERFQNGWREGAYDLAHVIREITPGIGTSTGQRTMITDRPVTIMTRSLISEQRASSSRLRFSEGTTPPTPSQSTPIVELIARGSAPLPAMPDVGSAPVASLSAALLPSPELASVHGGATLTGTGHVEVRDRNHKWTLAVFGSAALVGVIAAISISLAPDDDDASDTRDPMADALALVAKAMTPPPAPVVTPIVTAIVQPPAPPPPPATVAPEPPRLPPVAAPEPPPATRPSRGKLRAAAAAAAKKPATAEAILRVSTPEAWATVAISGQPHKDTPGAVFHLSPGKYSVKLTNSDIPSTKHCSVTLEAGRVVTLTVEMQNKEDDPCWVE